MSLYPPSRWRTAPSIRSAGLFCKEHPMKTDTLIKQAMSALGRRKSKAKAAAARENGKKGGRPPRNKPPPPAPAQ